jgi:hypothetical protein
MLGTNVAGTKILLAAAVFLWAPSALGQTIGTAGAVNPAATGTPPGGGSRTINIGADVVFKERINTTASGAVQVLFVDRTALTVGPNSDITIDEFVFDPGAGTGSFVATLAKGSLRFVGGKISRNSGVTINTPSATIGIRGSVVGIVDFGGGLTVSNHDGNVQVNLPSGQAFTLPPGMQLSVTTDAGGNQTSSVAPVGSAPVGSDTTTTDTTGGTGNAGGVETDTAAAPPVFIPDEITDVYTQEPPPPSPPEPEPDTPPLPPEPPVPPQP